MTLLLKEIFQRGSGATPGIDGRSKPSYVPKGIPPGMPRIPVLSEESASDRVGHIFQDIKRSLGLPVTPSDFRALAFRPDYLEMAWGELRPAFKKQGYRARVEPLQSATRELIRNLPYPPLAKGGDYQRSGLSLSAAELGSGHLDDGLAGLILTSAAFKIALDGGEAARVSPFPI